MLSVAICEDDTLTLDILAQMIEDYGRQTRCPLRVAKFTTGSMLLRETEKTEPFDIFILDYYMPFLNGIEVAKCLRERGETGIIIFSTCSMDGVMDAFEVNTFRYLLKPMAPETLQKVLDAAREQLKKTDTGYFGIRTAKGMRKVKEEDILFVEKINRSLLFHMLNGEQIASTTIQGSVKNAVQPLLESADFIMAGPGLLLNVGRIASVSRGDVFFCNGEEITPPRREYTAVKTAWNAHGVG